MLTFGSQLQAQQSIDVRIDRWLSIQSLSGSVQFLSALGDRPAIVGDKLLTMGDGIRTGYTSSSVLEIDTGIGTIDINEDTEIKILGLDRAEDNGRITRLYLSQGSVKVNLRRFTNQGSEFEIETPTGVSGVRGTEFGVIVHPEDERTGIATQTGEIEAEAQSEQVIVQAGYQTLIRPGEPPLEPTLIPDEPEFEYRIETIVRDGLRFFLLAGQINPINQAFVRGELQPLNESGEFRYEVPAYYGASIQVTVVTPLGDETIYDIALL